MDIRTYLKENILLFDGSMGTYCGELYPHSVGTPCELLNLSDPDSIGAIHAAYIRAGAGAIKTNTFAANRLTMDENTCRAVLTAGWRIAAAYADSAFVFADIGPIAADGGVDAAAEYRFVADVFLACGADCFLFETNSDTTALAETAAYIKEKNPAAFVLCSFAALPDGFTRSGQAAEGLLAAMAACDSIDAVGLNCASGARHMAALVGRLSLPAGKPFAAMPNAGYPTVLGNRTFYDGAPAYFGGQIGIMAEQGVTILGGCCGTTPTHIQAAAVAVANPAPAVTIRRPAPKVTKREANTPFWAALCDPDKRPFAVELDPPDNADIHRFMAGARELVTRGTAAITVADCPIGRARMDASLLACKLHRELGVDVLPHMTCRDRNLNAIQALLLGLCAEGVHHVLAVTGDPIPSAQRDEVKSVYNFNSRMLAGYITALAEGPLSTPFHIFGALNVNARNFDMQLKLALEKEQKGVCGFLTQPILTQRAVDNVKKARQVLKGKILGGIYPPVSYKNACFMHSEVAGVQVDDRLMALYDSKTRDEAEALARRVATDVAAAIHDHVDGYYLMTPFSRTALAGDIMEDIHKR